MIELVQHDDLSMFAQAAAGPDAEVAVFSFHDPAGVQGRLLVAIDGDYPKVRVLHGTPKAQRSQIKAALNGLGAAKD